MTIGGGASGGFQNVQVMLTADNSNLKSVLTQSGGYVNAFVRTAEGAARGSTTWGKALGVGLAGGALAAGAGLIYATSKALDFDKAMRNVNSLAGLSERELASLEKRVVSMSTRLPQSATTLAEGLYDITSSGFSGADAMKILESSALSASAGLTTTEVSAKAIAATLNAYGLTAKDAADVSDTLFQVVNAGVISFDELAGNLGDVVGGAAAAKVGIDQVGSAIAAMTLAGIGGAESTTSLNALLQKLIQPSKALTALYGQLGYESGAAALEQDGLRVVMDRIRVATGGNITALLKLFPEIRAARGALALMANEGENYSRVAAQIEDKSARAGATQRVFNEQMKAASNQLALAKNQADAFAIKVGIKLLPALVDTIEGARELGSAIVDGGSAVLDEFAPALEKLSDVLGNTFVALGHVGEAVWTLVEPFAKLAIGGAAVALDVLASVLQPLSEMISENSGAAVVLAVALGVTLAGGAGRAAATIGGYLVLGLVNLLSAMGAIPARAAAARAALVAAAPGAAIVAAITLAVAAWQSYNREAKSITRANEGIRKSFDKWDLEGAAEHLDSLQKSAKDYKDRIADIGEVHSIGDLADDWLRVDKNAKATAASNAEVEEKAASAKEQFDNLVQSAVYLEQELGGVKISTEQYARLMDDVAGKNGAEAQTAAYKELGGVLQKFGPALKDLGADFENGIQADDIRAAQAYMDQLSGTTAETADAQGNLIDALGKVDTALGDASKAADDLDKALDNLMGAAMGADAASINFRQGLADLTGALKENGRQILGNSLAAGKNRLAIQDQVKNLNDLLVAQAKNGAGSAKLTRTMLNGRDAIIAAGKAAGVSAGDMGKLLNQYKLTPSMVRTLITQYGGANVKKMLRDIQGEADKTGKKKPTVRVGVSSQEAIDKLNGVTTYAKSLSDVIAGKPLKPKVDNKSAKDNLDEVGRTADDVNKKKVSVPTSAPGAAGVLASLNSLRAMADSLNGRTVTVTTIHRDKQAKADGGFVGYGSGATGPLPRDARIQPARGAGLVQWAEAETGGEAFIPMGASKREGSKQILAQVAAAFGLELVKPEAFADGGFHFTYPPFKYKDFKFHKKRKSEKEKDYRRDRAKAKREYDRDKAQAKREYEQDKSDARYQAYAQWRENQRLAATAAGGGDGAFVARAGDAAGTLRGLQDSMESRAQAAAQLAANRSANPYDSAEDFYKAPTLSIKDYIAALKQSEAATRAWGSTMKKVSSVAGADVVSSLRAMGEDGEEWVKKMATATTAEMQAMAAELRKIQMDAFQTDLVQDNAAQSKFQQDLMTLVGRGRADLAAKFADMGYENAGGLAAQAATMSDSELAALAGQVATGAALSDTDQQKAALSLASILQGSQTPLGVVGLAGKSGKSLADVLGLLTTYGASIFDHLPASAMAQVRADQALLSRGKQPSGLAYGGIVPGSKAGDGLYYQWAEKSSGGESLIPLGIDRRRRALQIWEATGRMIGAGSPGGGGTITVVQPGAVTVRVDASGQALTAAQVKSIADSAAGSAMAQLAQRLNNR